MDDNFIYCSKCGTKNSKDAKFCSKCGTKLYLESGNLKNTTDDIKNMIINSEIYKTFTEVNYDENTKADFDNEIMLDFIQKNTEYYIPKFKEIQESKNPAKWNWASFLFSEWWFLYRKMYIIGLIILIVDIFLSMITKSWLTNIVISVIFGFYGNAFYLRHIQSELESIKNVSEATKKRLILEKGGVNNMIPVIYIAMVAIIAISLIMFMSFISILI
jgi:hypothetical protein